MGDAWEQFLENSHLRRNLEEFRRRDEPAGGATATIFRVPNQLHQGYIDACKPKNISIGPYHRGQPELKAMEVYKLQYLNDFLQGSTEMAMDQTTAPLQLKDLFLTMKKIEKRARSCYSEAIDMKSDEFVEMILLDGCFIIEFMSKQLQLQSAGQAPPIISTRFRWLFVLHDLLALENQLPFIVLQCLYFIRVDPIRLQEFLLYLDDNLVRNTVPITNELIDKLFKLFSLSQNQLFKNLATRKRNPDHLLHLFHHALTSLVNPCNRERSKDTRLYRRAVELELSGVTFKTMKATSILNVRFHKGVLEMSPLFLDNHFDAFIRNFIAIEQCDGKYDMRFTSYLSFLDGLVDSNKDVELLVKRGIFHNFMGSNEDAIKHFFNGCCYNIVLDHKQNHLRGVQEEIGNYCKKSWPKRFYKLSRDYFNSPWSLLSFLAAVLLLSLTVLQTTFTIIRYFKIDTKLSKQGFIPPPY